MTPRGNSKEFIYDIIDALYRKNNVDKYQIITQQYHQRSELKNMRLKIQTIMARACSNQLTTRSKMEKWFHDSLTCPNVLMHMKINCTRC
jgi:hypothetical protein